MIFCKTYLHIIFLLLSLAFVREYEKLNAQISLHLISYANFLVSDFAFSSGNMSCLIYAMAHLGSRTVVISVNHFSSDVTVNCLKHLSVWCFAALWGTP